MPDHIKKHFLTMCCDTSCNHQRRYDICDWKSVPTNNDVTTKILQLSDLWLFWVTTLSLACDKDIYTTLELIETMEFKIAMQSSSKINCIVCFHEIINLLSSKMIAPDDIGTKEIKYIINGNSTAENKDLNNKKRINQQHHIKLTIY